MTYPLVAVCIPYDGRATVMVQPPFMVDDLPPRVLTPTFHPLPGPPHPHNSGCCTGTWGCGLDLLDRYHDGVSGWRVHGFSLPPGLWLPPRTTCSSRGRAGRQTGGWSGRGRTTGIPGRRTRALQAAAHLPTGHTRDDNGGTGANTTPPTYLDRHWALLWCVSRA